jgi:hypothetical protein
MPDVFTPVRVADQAFDGLPTQAPPIGSTPASISPTNVDGGGSSVDGPITDSLAVSGTPSDVSQTIAVTPQQTPVALLRGDSVSVGNPPPDSLAVSGTPADVNQTIGITPQQTPVANVNGDLPSPVSANTITTTQNSTVNQVFGKGVPTNVFV